MAEKTAAKAITNLIFISFSRLKQLC